MTAPSPKTKNWPYVLIGVVGLLSLALVAVINALPASGGTAARPVLSISNSTANTLEVNPLATLDVKAPRFNLKDQHARTSTLASFRGKAVILTFGDDQCTDLCTLLAEDVLAANRDLGQAKKRVEFVSINANTFYPSVATTSKWTVEQGLSHTANWHFLTGNPATLKALARDYGVDVELDHQNRTIVHGTDMFFIDPSGHEVQIGQFGVESANTAQFAHAMAQLAVETLPDTGTLRVGGPSPVANKREASSDVGATPSPVELPRVDGGAPISTATYRGKYVVLNFWSTTCPICTTELPAVEKAYASGDPHSIVLGIDVSDPAATAVDYIRRMGVRYPILNDSDGATSGQFAVAGLPYTVILDPRGRVVVRHPGAITTEQLEYLLQTLETESPNG